MCAIFTQKLKVSCVSAIKICEGSPSPTLPNRDGEEDWLRFENKNKILFILYFPQHALYLSPNFGVIVPCSRPVSKRESGVNPELYP